MGCCCTGGVLFWLCWLTLSGPQPACSNSSKPPALLLRLPPVPAVSTAPVETGALALLAHVGFPPVSLTLGPAARVGLHDEGHQSHTQVTSGVDVDPWWWQETYTRSSFPRGHKFVLSLTNVTIFPPQWPPLLTSGSAPSVEKQLI